MFFWRSTCAGSGYRLWLVGSSGGILNQALNGTLPDQDEDGLYDIAPPLSVPFGLDATLGTRIRNTIMFAEAEGMRPAMIRNHSPGLPLRT